MVFSIVPRARSSCSLVWVAIRLVRSSAPPGGALLRTSLMATHEREHLDRALATVARVGADFPERPAWVVSARTPSYVFGVPAVNPHLTKFRPTHSLRATISASIPACPESNKRETTPAGGCQLVVKGR